MALNMTKKKILSLVALLPLLLFAVPNAAKAQAGKDDDGQKLYDQNCVKCHGADGSGTTVVGKAVGAKDLRAPEAKKLTDAEIFAQIDQGKGNMPPFGGTLSKSQINSLVAIVRELSKKAAAPGKKAG